MLVVSRKAGEAICIADDIEVVVLKVGRGRIKLGVNVRRGVPVLRKELIERQLSGLGHEVELIHEDADHELVGAG